MIIMMIVPAVIIIVIRCVRLVVTVISYPRHAARSKNQCGKDD